MKFGILPAKLGYFRCLVFYKTGFFPVVQHFYSHLQHLLQCGLVILPSKSLCACAKSKFLCNFAFNQKTIKPITNRMGKFSKDRSEVTPRRRCNL
jgi:hypothetical protein